MEDNSVIAVNTNKFEQTSELIDFIASEYKKNGRVTIKGDVVGFLKPIDSLEKSYNEYIDALKNDNILDDSVTVRHLVLETDYPRFEQKSEFWICLGILAILVFFTFYQYRECKTLESEIKKSNW